MKTIDLEKALVVCDKATKGPWISYVEGRDHDIGSNFIMTGNEQERGYDIEFYSLREEDQDFIAMSRNMLPEMIREVLRLQKILEDNSIPF